MHFVNPLTAIGLVEEITNSGCKAAIQTGAASQLGRMVINLVKDTKIPLINIVRREEQVKMLKEEYGCEYVLNSSTESFKEDLSVLCKKLKPTECLECVGGPIVGTILECMGSRSTIHFYGALSESGPTDIDALKMIGRNQKVSGWILNDFLDNKGIRILGVISQCKAMMANEKGTSKVQKKFPISQFRENVGEYYKNMSGGKFLLAP